MKQQKETANLRFKMAVSPYSAELADIVGWAEHRFVSRDNGAGPAVERTDPLPTPSPDGGQTAPHVVNAAAEPAPPAALLLLGRSGTGKSHLLRELLSRAAGAVPAEQDAQRPSSWWPGGEPRAVVIEGESVRNAIPLSPSPLSPSLEQGHPRLCYAPALTSVRSSCHAVGG